MTKNPSKKTIFFVLPALNGGGAERVTLHLLRAFQDSRSWRPVLVLTTRHIGQLDAELPSGIEVIRIGAANGRRAIPTLLALFRSRRPNIIFTSLDHVNITLGLLKSVLPRKTALVLRATNFLSLKSFGMRWLLAHAFRSADTVIFQSPQMRLQMLSALKLPQKGRWETVPNPLDRERIERLAAEALPGDCYAWQGAAGTAVNLVAAGRLSPQKGFDLLIEAMRLLDLPHLRLNILGDGDQESELRAKISAAGLEDKVRLCGFQKNPYAWFSAADAFVLPSRVEGFPNVVLEALACGCPVIATPLPGLEDLPGCILTEDISSAALASAIRSFIENRHSVDANRALCQFDITSIRQRYEAIFESLFIGSD